MRRRAASLCLLVGVALGRSTVAQPPERPARQQPPVPPRSVGGVVRDSAGRTVGGAEAFLLVPPGGRTLTATTDSAGLFEFREPGGTGEYVLTVVAAGYRPIRRRIARDGDGERLRVVVTLTSAAQTLAGVAVVEQRSAPAKSFVYEIGVGGLEAAAAGTRAVMNPALDGITDALRSNLMVEGASLAGLPSTESRTQLHGLSFRGTTVPRSAPVSIRAGLGEYDVAVGGYSGGRIAVDVAAAGEFTRRSGEIVVEAGSPTLAARTVRAGPPRAARLAVDLGGTSRFGLDGAGLSWGARVTRSADPNVSLASIDSSTLRELGVAPGVVTALDSLDSLDSPGRAWPLRAAPALGARSATTSATGTLRFDPRLSRSETNAFVLVGSATGTEPALVNPLAAAPRAVGSRSGELAVQHLFRKTDAKRGAWDLRTGFTGAFRRAADSPLAPLASVRVQGRADPALDGGLGAPILVGGPSGALASRGAAGEFLLQHDRFVGAGEARQRKLLLGGRAAWFSSSTEASATVDVPSLDALPSLDAAHVWTRSPERVTGGARRLTAGASYGARSGARLRLTVGARTDYQQLLSPAAAGSRRAQSLDLSPRLGLTWNFAAPTEGPGYMTSNLETRQLVPPGVLRVGAGLFVSDLEPELGALPAGAPGHATEVMCALDAGPGALGDADAGALTPDGLQRARLGRPDGSGAATYRSTAALAPGFRPSRSARVSASFVTRWRLFDVHLDGVLAANDRQPGIEDHAVAGAPTAVLDGGGEMGRGFHAPLAAIGDDGFVRPGRAVEGSLLSRALVQRSDRRTLTRRLSVQVGTRNGGTRSPIRLGYSIGRTDAEEGGWDRDAFGSPWQVERAPSRLDRRHQLQLEVARSFYGVSLSWWMRAASGAPYTPLVDGDVNGDRNARNDRARIPAAGSPSPEDREFWRVMDAAPGYARRCALAQAGAVAARASCRAPWSVRSALYVAFDPAEYIVRASLAQVNVIVENPLGWLGGRLGASGLRALSRTADVDPVLIRVRAFDRAAASFRYAPNPTFGQRTTSLGTDGGGHRITIAVRVPLSRGIQRQQLDRWLARNGVGQGVGVDTLAARFARNVPNFYDAMLGDDDELGLTAVQRELLTARRAELGRSLWDIWTALGRDLVASGARRGSDALLARVQRATDLAWEASRLSANRLPEVLTPVQESLLPSPASALVRATKPVQFKIIYY